MHQTGVGPTWVKGKNQGEGSPVCCDTASCCGDTGKCAGNFSCCCDKISDKGNLKKEGFTFVDSLKEYSLSRCVKSVRMLVTLHLRPGSRELTR